MYHQSQSSTGLSQNVNSKNKLNQKSIRKLTKDDFQFYCLIGKGSYGEVWLAAKKDTNKYYAIKIIDKLFIARENKQHSVFIEKEILTRLQHRCIIQLYYSFQDKYKLYFVLEYAAQGSFSDYLILKRNLSLDAIKFYSAKLVQILEFLHTNGIAHRDLKPDNLLLTDSFDLKIIDFGTAKFFPGQHRDNQIFQGIIAAQEQLAQVQDQCNLKSTIVDIYLLKSLKVMKVDLPQIYGLQVQFMYVCIQYIYQGCIIYQMYYGYTPFSQNVNSSQHQIYERIKNLQYTISDDCPSTLKDLIQRLLVRDPNQRIGSAGLSSGYCTLKSHDFFTGIDFETLDYVRPPEAEFKSAFEPNILQQAKLEDSSNEQYQLEKTQEENIIVNQDLRFLTNSENLSKINNNEEEKSNEIQTKMMTSEDSFIKLNLNRVINESYFSSSRCSSPGKKIEIILQGYAEKKSTWLFYKSKKLVLTNVPRLVYYDSDNVYRGEIKLSKQTQAFLDGKNRFFVKNFDNIYSFRQTTDCCFGTNPSPEEWVKMINLTVQSKYRKCSA